jgi:hypothetical protein
LPVKLEDPELSRQLLDDFTPLADACGVNGAVVCSPAASPTPLDSSPRQSATTSRRAI